MLLAIDIGNTNIKLGLFRNGELCGSWRLSAAAVRTADEYGNDLGNILERYGFSFSDISGTVMSSVIPSLNYTFEHMLQYFIPHTVNCVVTPHSKMNIKLGYDNPSEIGSDRIANSVAAYEIYGGPCIVIDFGTATTFNAIDGDGVFRGGCICAGVKLSMEALSATASKLPYIEISRPETVIGKSTITNMQAGAVFGLIGQVKYIIEKMKEEKGFRNAKIIATGGLSELVSAEEKIIDITDRTLTLYGLNILYNLNKDGKP